MHLIFALQRSRFIWLNLLFTVYLWLLQPAVLQRLGASTQGNDPDWLMGGLLLGIQVIEMAGLLLKRPVGAFYARRYPDSNAPGGWWENAKVALFVFIPIFHLSLAAFLAMIALGLLKMGGGNETAAILQCLSVLLVFAIITKEAFFVTLLLGIGLAGSALDHNIPTGAYAPWVERANRWLAPPEITQITQKDALKDMAGDLLLLAFSALAYTALWEFITADALRAQGSGRLWEYLGVSILFFMVYFTTRSVYLMQELSIQQSRAARVFTGVSFLAIWLAVLWAIPR
jgi:hypothetical protein